MVGEVASHRGEAQAGKRAEGASRGREPFASDAPAIIDHGPDAEEFEKRLGSAMLKGDRVVVIDNVDDALTDATRATLRRIGPCIINATRDAALTVAWATLDGSGRPEFQEVARRLRDRHGGPDHLAGVG